jgi:predicted SAM-dependent methyltransferase
MDLIMPGTTISAPPPSTSPTSAAPFTVEKRNRASDHDAPHIWDGDNVHQDQKVVLHVGCGNPNPMKLHSTFRSSQWREVRLDLDPNTRPDIVASITHMPEVSDQSVDAVWSSHNLEHLYAHEIPVALGEFRRVLKPGGFVLITTPDLQEAAKAVAAGNVDDALYESPAGPVTALDVLFGFQKSVASGNEFMAHRYGFTTKTLGRFLEQARFRRGRVDRHGMYLWARAWV